MTVEFDCSQCRRRLTVEAREEARPVICPICRAESLVPGAENSPPALPPATPQAAQQVFAYVAPRAWSDNRVRVGAIMGGAAVFLAIVLVAVTYSRKIAANPAPQARAEEPPPESPPPVAVPPVVTPPLLRAPGITPPVTAPPATPPVATQPVQPKPDVKPEPPKQADPLGPPRLDQFGNPIGRNQGLAKQDEFTGQRILFWSPHAGAEEVFFSAKNPLWKALTDKGFVVRREYGKFQADWLKDTDQFWLLSTAPEEFLRARRDSGITADDIVKTLKLLPPDAFDEAIKASGTKVPPGWTREDLVEMMRADFALGLSPVYHLTAKDYDAIMDFVKAGKGLCLLAENDPCTTEASELAKRLFGVGVSGNYPGEKIAYVRERKLTAAEIGKYKGDYAVPDHPLLTGVNFVYEGVTIGGIPESDKLDVALRSSDGKPVVAVSKVPGRRVIIDCGYTRYYHGHNDRVSYILITAGTVRLAQNMAAYLAGKETAEKPK